MSNLLKTIPLYIVLLPLFFCLHGALENLGIIKANSLSNLGIQILEVLLVVFVIMWLLTKKLSYAGIVTFALGTWYLFFGALADTIASIKWLHFLNNFTAILLLSLLIIIVLLVLLRNKVETIYKVNYFLNILLIVYCCYDAATLIFNLKNQPVPVAVTAKPFNSSLVKEKPNVYYLLFDEYPGKKSLKDSFNYSNDSLYSFFNKMEFREMPTFSNYNFTYYSISSIYNMQYVSPLIHPEAIDQTDYQLRKNEISNSKVMHSFLDMNYKIYNLSSFEMDIPEKNIGYQIPANNHTSLITDKILHKRCISYYGRDIMKSRFSNNYIAKFFMATDGWNKFAESKLAEIVTDTVSGPKFTYAHFFLPHAPVYYDSTGKYVSKEIMFGTLVHIEKEVLLSHVKYTNTKIQSIVSNIVAKDPGAIVIVMSDHGMRHYHSATPNEPFFFDNICFLRFPNKNYPAFRDKWSNVNVYPYVFNSQFNQQIPYQQDSTVLILDKEP